VPARGASLLLLLAAALPIGLFLLREHQIAGGPGFPLDDSWIHLHFARNIAEGAGFSYNPGVPVAGSTAPLWTLLLGGLFALCGPSVTAVKAVGVATAIAAGWLTTRAARAWGAGADASLAAGAGLLLTGPMAWGALSGMEVALAAALVAAALWAHADKRPLLAALAGVLAALSRPEALVLLPLLGLATPGLRPRMAQAVVVAVALAPSVAFSLLTVGRPVPATAVAKIEGGLAGWLSGVQEPLWQLVVGRPWEFFAEWVGWLWATHWLIPVLLAPALAIVASRSGGVLAWPALALVLHPLAMAWLAPYRGPGFQEGRYSMHLLPLAFVVLAAALGSDRVGPRRLLGGAWLAMALVALPPAATRYGWAVQNIEAMQVHLGHWVAANLPRGARLALNDIGAIAFVSRYPVLDLMGLVTPDIIPYRRQGEEGVLRYVVEQCPDHVIVFPAWFPRMTARRDLLEPVYAVRLERNEVAGAPEMVVYRVRACEL
jgi:hypothetical protein